MNLDVASPPSGSRRLAATFAGALAIFVGGSVLVGWALDIAALKSILPGWVTVKPNTALGFVLTGLALLSAFRPPSSARPGLTTLVLRCGRLCALLAGLIGLMTLGEYLFGWDAGIDQRLFPEAAGAVATSHLGRMAPDTALSFVLVAAALWFAGGSRKTTRQSGAMAILGSLVTIAALAEVLSFFTPNLRNSGWSGLTMMALPTAVLFAILGATIVYGSWRDALRPRLIQFSRNLWSVVVCLGALAITFALYARSEGEIAHVNELRYRSFLLADELRQSGDDLTRMARTYVVTGDPVYKRHFQDILDIRDGRKPRPDHYWRPYWDLVLGDGPAPRASQQAIPLLQLMRQSGFTEEELGTLAEAKANSDGLTLPEFEAMKLVESTGPEVEADRARARRMMHDESYHRAKAGVMGPIDRFLVRVDERTATAVRSAEHSAEIYRYLLGVFGLALMFTLWRAYLALGDTLGGSVDEVSAHIARIGQGDFAAAIPLKAGLEESVLGWLSQTQARLHLLERDRKATERETAQRNLLLNALINSPSDLVIFSLDRNFCYTAFNEKHRQEMRKVWDAAIQLGDSLLESMSDSGLRALARQSIERALAGEAFTEVHDQPGAEISYELNWSPIRQADGGVTGVTAFIRDITERQRAEERLQNSEAFLSRVIEQSPSSTWIADAKGTLLRANAACCALLHITEAEVVGRYNLFEDNIVAEQGYLPLVRSVFESGETARFELLYDSSHLAGVALHDTVALVLDVTIFPIKDSQGRITHAVVQHLDITERRRAEADLRKTERARAELLEKLNSAQQFATIGSWELNAVTNEVWWSDETYRIFDVTPEQHIPSVASNARFIHPEDRERYGQLFQDCLRTGTPLETEVRLVTDAGLLKHCEVKGTAVVDDDGLAARFFGTIMDVSERKRADEELRASEERFRMASETANDVVYDWDLKQSVQWMGRVDEMLGYEPGAFPRTLDGWTASVHPDDLAHTIAAIQAHLEGRAPYDIEYRVRRKDGVYRWWWARGAAARTPDGTPVRWIGSITDITERKQAEAELVEAQSLRTEAEKLGKVGSWEFDTDTKALTWTEEVFHIHEVDLTYQPTVDAGIDFYAPASRPIIAQAVQRAIEQGEPFDVELEIVTAKGNRRHVHSIGRADPTRRKVLGFFQDITAQKHAEEEVRHLNAELEQRVRERTTQLETANKELEAFSYSVSHDLRAPLRAIDGFGNILLQDHGSNLDPEGHRVLGVIASETRRMGRLIDDLLAFSRLGRHKLETVEVDMQAMARAIFEDQAAQAPQRILELDLQALPKALGDPAMIRVVWTNLLSNAIKFTQGRTPALISIGSRREDEQEVYFIRDNGVGFDMSYADKLFGVFQRLHSANEFEGTGVGLALVQRVIHRHGGRIRGEGKVGSGATFSFTLPSPGGDP